MTRQSPAWWWLAFALIAAFYGVLGVRGLAAPWHWGHNGYNGAAFSQAAKNSMRFDIVGQAPYHFETEPPPAAEIYTHHPLALHGHVVASFALFGAKEWAARLVPFAYSIATLLLLMIAVRRYWGDRTALLAGLAYALTPLNLIFANMVNHEQGGLFGCLVLVYAYLRWLETGRLLHAVLCGLGLTLAVQFDWPGYYVAFLLAVHCIVTGVRGRAPKHWRWFLVVFSALTLANLFAFLGWIYVTRPGLQDMAEAFRLRNRMPRDGSYLVLIMRRLLALHGPILVAAAAVGATSGVLSWRRESFRARTMLPLAFLFAGTVHVIAFTEAAALHSYWIYYWGPAVAIAAAIGLESIIDWGHARVHRVSSIVVAAVVVLSFAAAQGTFAWRTWLTQLDHGHGADCDPCDFQRLERAWFTTLGAHYATQPRYAIHPSIRAPRIELLYYLDAPHHWVDRVAQATHDDVLLVDLHHMRRSEHAHLGSLTRRHAATVWMNRFVAIDLRTTQPSLVRFEAEDEDLSLTKWWLTTQTSDPPLRWRRVPSDR